MKKLISLLLGCSVILAGCASQEANPIIVYQPANENQSDAAINAPVGAPSVEETQKEVENQSYTAINAPVDAPSFQEALEEVESNREPDVIYVPTPQDVVDKMLELAEVKKDDLVYDLGCGDGRIVVTAAKRFGCQAVGYDIDPERVEESLENVQKNEVGHMVRIEQKDIFTLDLSKANVITLYLLPSLNVKLIPQLEKLKPGSRIVSHDFRMKGVKPDKVVKLTSNEDGSEHKIFLWTLPLKKRKIEDTAPVENDSF
ncbi:MAG TPA: methyltransferase domain-containing protein [Sedimentisphaerales bacterium]|nr:methyltransferase domain-containing protein [Sedimentisphaerales bacterium]